MSDQINYEDIPLNVVVDDEGFDQAEQVPDSLVYGDTEGRSKTTSLPQEFSRPLAVPVFSQGSIGSCVGASGKVVTTDRHYPKDNLSALWIYKEAKKHDAWKGENYSGTSISGACKAIIGNGVCLEKFYPYVSDESAVPKSGAVADASTRRFSKYYALPLKDADKLKRLIMQETLWTSFHVHKEFYTVSRDGFMKNEAGYLSTPRSGGHAMALVGWKTVEGKLFLKFQNSWGKYWGNNGFVYISHELYSKVSKGVFMVDSQTEAPTDPSIADPMNKKPKNLILQILEFPISIVKAIIGIFKKKK